MKQPRAPDHRIVARLIKVRDLPTLPEVIEKILKTVDDERSSASDLTTLLECDSAISVRVLRLANSAFYGLRNRVSSIRHAVVVLGFDAVHHLALATSVFETFAKRQQFALDPDDFWMHSFGAAKAAQILCDGAQRDVSPEECFTAALLHDIGKYLLALVLKEEYRAIVQEAQRAQRPLKDLEYEVFGMTHAAVGGWVTGKWQFPSGIVDAIGNIYRVPAYNGPHRTTTAIVASADIISRLAAFGYAGDRAADVMPPYLLKILRLTEDNIAEITSELERLREETRQFLDLLTDDQR